MQVLKKRWLIPAALAACLFLIDFRALFRPIPSASFPTAS